MQQDPNESGPGFKITDKRRFSSDGSQRGNEESTSQKKATPKKSEVTSVENLIAPDAEFSNFIVSLATQASMQLGLVQAPPGVPLRIDLNAARQTIDIIAMLKRKTVGNISQQEAELFDKALHELEIGFEECKQRGQ